MLPSRTAIIVAGGLTIAGFAAGWKVNQWRHEAALAEDITVAAITGDELQANAAEADSLYLNALLKEKDAQYARAKRLDFALRKARADLDECHVSEDVLRVLNDAAGAATPGVPAESLQPAPDDEADPGAASGATCADVIDTYYWNVENVVRPNALQLEQLAAFYRALRAEYCKKTKAC